MTLGLAKISQNTKSTNNERKTGKLDTSKWQTSALPKTLKWKKRQATDWEDIDAYHISGKELYSDYVKNFQHSTVKKRAQQNNEQKVWTNTSSNIWTNEWKDVQCQ